MGRYLARVTDTEATDTKNPNLNYGIVVDCGSSGSRVFVYCWPRHNGNPHDLLDIKQMRDSHRKPVVMKIKPGISEFAASPDKVSDYISPLLSFAAEHVPRSKHKETPLYILCTAGMRILPESQQKAILEDLLTDIPVHFDFLFSDSHAEVISGKQEGENGQRSEEVAKNLLAEFNLGCDAHQTEHVYRVYVATFLGFGGNAARQRYQESLAASTLLRNRVLGTQTGLSPDSPSLDQSQFLYSINPHSSHPWEFSDYCATRWAVLRERFDRGLYASHADLHRLKYQCFKSAWMFEVFHRGFSFPESYGSLKTALQVYDKEVQWTLGAILYRTRFLPLRDIQQDNFRGIHSRWRSFSFVYNHFLFLGCFGVVLLSILLYLLRLRRIHRRLFHPGSAPSLWIHEGLPQKNPQKTPNPL
ncbi:ectonucleoside triphosphate diphosphohydrolase 4-like [Malurus melanocephalus]|uniref:ectonucleoside triphosphate diphosphohydrolase 4-like n=1 Tax=Malurus melanocephalus TaxID=175006 RepID=UPI002547CFD4|nr:ectonucleoside triphosphate diphosphohydrolase 4-like [Malurus melanocephalus]